MRGSSHFLWLAAKKVTKENSTGFGAVGRLGLGGLHRLMLGCFLGTCFRVGLLARRYARQQSLSLASCKESNQRKQHGFRRRRAAPGWVTPSDVRALLWNLLSCRSISSPLCAAAVTFFAAAKKVTKESS